MKRLTRLTAVLLLCVALNSHVLAQDAETPTRTIYQAASLGDIEQVKLHIARGTDLNQPDSNQNTALGLAVVGMRLEVVKLLVDAGANVAAPSREGPPVIMAVVQGSAEIVEFLVGQGGNLETTNAAGSTPLIVAAESGYFDIVELLVAKGANVNAKDRRGQTPLSSAIARRQTDVAQFLRQNGAEEPVSAFDGSPYGSRGMAAPPGAGSSVEPDSAMAHPSQATALQLLGDPNEIRARVAAFPELGDAIAALDTASAAEQRNWRQRRTDNRNMLIRSAEKQFEDEMTLVKRIGQTEKAAKTIAEIDALVVKRKARCELIYQELREERRLAVLAEREATARARSSARTRGRAGTMDPTAGGGANDPYAGAPARPAPRTRGAEETDEPAVEPEMDSHAQAWLSSDPLDKRNLLNTVHEVDLREFDALRQTAVAEEAKKTAAAIEGLMLARQERVTSIMAKMAEEDERLERLEERAGTMTAPGATRGRGARGATAPQEDPAAQRGGRRYR